MKYQQAFCVFRDEQLKGRVILGLTGRPRDVDYIRLVCSESHRELELVVIDFLQLKDTRPKHLSLVQKFLYDHCMDREFAHLFSVKDDFGMLYHMKGIKETVNFTVPFKVRPHAGAYGFGYSTLNEDDLRKRLFENPTIYREFSLWRDTDPDPIYILEHMILLDPTGNKQSRYRRDNKGKSVLVSTRTTVPTKEEMEIRKNKTNKIASKKQCAWPGCGKLEGSLKFSHCGKCSRVSYCSIVCQRKDWRFHKLICTTNRIGEQLQSWNW
jgi:hypothetical protein